MSSHDGAAGRPDGPVIDFDQHSVEYRDRWREISDENLARCPVAWTTSGGGHWVVTGHAALRQATTDYRTFSSRWDLSPIHDGQAGISIPPGPYPKIPAELDPPEFWPYRRIIAAALSPERSALLEPFIRDTVDRCLSQVQESGDLDFILDLAAPLATSVVLHVLGLPVDHSVTLGEALHVVEYTRPGMPAFERAAGVLADFVQVIDDAQRSARGTVSDGPERGLVAALVRAAGRGIDEKNIVGICYLVLGSVDNTAGFIASTLYWLHENPDRRRELVDEPRLIGGAVEELLRYLAPIHGLARTATRDVELGGCRVRAGDRLYLHFAGANRDPAEFDQPDEVRFDRLPNRHASFGFGIHRCVGGPVTRIEARVVLETVLANWPDYTIRVADTHRYQDISKFNGFERMPARLWP